MMGFGFLFMLLILGLPVVLIAAILIGIFGLLGQRSRSMFSPPTTASLAMQNARTCAHCGQALQGDWTHCPKCGAPN